MNQDQEAALKDAQGRANWAMSIARDTILHFIIDPSPNGSRPSAGELNIAMAIFAAKLFDASPPTE